MTGFIALPTMADIIRLTERLDELEKRLKGYETHCHDVCSDEGTVVTGWPENLG